MCVNEVCLFLSTRNPKPSLRLQCLVDTALAMCVPRLCLFSLSRSLCVSVSLSRRPPWSRFCLAWPRQHTIFLFSRVSVDRSCYSAPGDVVHPGAMSIQSLDPQTVSVVFSVTLLLSPCLPSTKLGRSRPSRRPVCWSNFFLCDSLSLSFSLPLSVSLFAPGFHGLPKALATFAGRLVLRDSQSLPLSLSRPRPEGGEARASAEAPQALLVVSVPGTVSATVRRSGLCSLESARRKKRHRLA